MHIMTKMFMVFKGSNNEMKKQIIGAPGYNISEAVETGDGIFNIGFILVALEQVLMVLLYIESVIVYILILKFLHL